MYIVEPEVEPHLNLIRKFEPESNLILAEPELEPKPCDIAYRGEVVHLSTNFGHVVLFFVNIDGILIVIYIWIYILDLYDFHM
jgi:hypothetical protein